MPWRQVVKSVKFQTETEVLGTHSALELAQTIHSKAGSSCEIGELAAWMGQSATGGTFRTRLGATRMFGLIENSQGRTTLTQLGRDVLDGSGSERAARVAAFLNVELFRVMYDQYKGNALPRRPLLNGRWNNSVSRRNRKSGRDRPS
jgi:hypothetical protein